jgi:hypothetical protein
VEFEKVLSVIMVYLAISLIFVWPVNAVITSIEISGGDGIKDYRAGMDVTNIKVTADNPVKIKTNTEGYVDLSCQETDGKYSCTHQFPSSQRNSGEYRYLFSDNLSGGNDIPKTFIVDGMNPTINSYDVYNDGTDLILKYDLKDTASTSGLNGVGVKKISLSSGSESIFEKTFNESKKIVIGEERISGTELVGDVNFYFTVEDALGNYVIDKAITKNFDLKKPTIENSLSIKQLDKEVTTISVRPEAEIIVDFTFFVVEDNLDKVFVKANEVNVNPMYAGAPSNPTLGLYYNKTANCVKEGEVKYRCSLKGMNFNPGKGSVTLGVTAIDKSGNLEFKNLTKQLTISDKQGEIIYFNPSEEHCYGSGNDNRCYVKNGINEFYVKISKGDADIFANFITLNVMELSTSSYIKPINCELEGNEYNCRAYLYVSKGGSGNIAKILLARPSIDSVGAPLKGITQSAVHLDFEVPQNISAINFTQTIGANVVNDTCPVSGERATFNVLIRDEFSPTVKIIAYTKDISSSEKVEEFCEPLANKEFMCSVDVENFVSYYTSEDIKIEIVDTAGNTLTLNKEVEICEADRNVVPELISSIKHANTIAGGTSSIDLKIASIIPLKVYLPFVISTRGTDVQVLAMEHDGCIGTEYSGNGETYFIGEESVSYYNKGTLVTSLGGYSYEQIDEEYLDNDDLEVPINCTIKLYVRDKNTRYLLPESEMFSTSIPTMNLPMGTVSENVEKTLSSLKKDIKTLNNEISDAEDWDVWYAGICNWAKLIVTLRGIVSGLKNVLYLAGLSASAVCDVSTVGLTAGKCFQLVYTTPCGYLSTVESVLFWMWPIADVPILGDSMKLFCMWHSCSQCTVAGTLSMGLTTIDLGVDVYDVGYSFTLDGQIENNAEDLAAKEAEKKAKEAELENAKTEEERTKINAEIAEINKEINALNVEKTKLTAEKTAREQKEKQDANKKIIEEECKNAGNDCIKTNFQTTKIMGDSNSYKEYDKDGNLIETYDGKNTYEQIDPLTSKKTKITFLKNENIYDEDGKLVSNEVHKRYDYFDKNGKLEYSMKQMNKENSHLTEKYDSNNKLIERIDYNSDTKQTIKQYYSSTEPKSIRQVYSYKDISGNIITETTLNDNTIYKDDGTKVMFKTAGDTEWREGIGDQIIPFPKDIIEGEQDIYIDSKVENKEESYKMPTPPQYTKEQEYVSTNLGKADSDGIYTKTVKGATALYYKKNTQGKWEWSPDKTNWMSVSTTTVSGGQYDGKSPVQANIDIIKELNKLETASPIQKTQIPVGNVKQSTTTQIDTNIKNNIVTPSILEMYGLSFDEHGSLKPVTSNVVNQMTGKATEGITYAGVSSGAQSILGGISNAGSMIDPYRSQKVAEACFCWPAQIYNSKKLLQLKCKEYKCIEENSKQGLPTNVCSQSYEVGKCIYYNGAYAEMKGINSWFEVLGENLPYEVMSIFNVNMGLSIYTMYCAKGEASLVNRIQNCAVSAPAGKDVLCSINNAFQFIRDFTATVNSFTSTIVDFTGIQTDNEYCEGLI